MVVLVQPEPAVCVLDRREDSDVLAALTAQGLEHANEEDEASPPMIARREPGAKMLGAATRRMPKAVTATSLMFRASMTWFIIDRK